MCTLPWSAYRISRRTKEILLKKKKKKYEASVTHMAFLFLVKEREKKTIIKGKKTLKITLSVKRDANIFVIVVPGLFLPYLL